MGSTYWGWEVEGGIRGNENSICKGLEVKGSLIFWKNEERIWFFWVMG